MIYGTIYGTIYGNIGIHGFMEGFLILKYWNRKYGNIGIIHGNTGHDVNLAPLWNGTYCKFSPHILNCRYRIMVHVFRS